MGVLRVGRHLLPEIYLFLLDGVLFLFFYLGIFYLIFFLDDVGVPRGGRY